MSSLEIIDIDESFLTEENLQTLDKYYDEYDKIIDDCDREHSLSKDEWCSAGNYAIIKDGIIVGYIISYSGITEPDLKESIIIDTLYISSEFLSGDYVNEPFISEVLNHFINEVSKICKVKRFKYKFPIRKNSYYTQRILDVTKWNLFDLNPNIQRQISVKYNYIYAFEEDKPIMEELPRNWFIFQCTYDEETFIENSEKPNEIWCLLNEDNSVREYNSTWLRYVGIELFPNLLDYCKIWPSMDDGRILFKINDFLSKLDVVCLLPYEPRGSFTSNFIYCPDTDDFNTLISILSGYRKRFYGTDGILLGLTINFVNPLSIWEVMIERLSLLESTDIYFYLK